VQGKKIIVSLYLFLIILKMKRLFWIIIACVLLHSCKQHTGYIIRGVLADADGTKVVLKKLTLDFDEPITIDSCVVKKGKFMMKGFVEYPEYCLLYAGNNGPVRLFVDNSVIDINLNLQKIQISEINGSRETDLLVAFYAQLSTFGDSASKINDDYLALKNSEEIIVEKEKEYLARMDTIRQQRIVFMKQFVEEHPNSIITALIIRELLPDLSPEELEQYASSFDELNSQSPWVQNLKEKVETTKRLDIGQTFVDFTMTTPDGNEISLSDYAGKDKYVLIDFWASWCRPCRMINPHLVKIYRKFKDKEFEIIGVSLDKDKTGWKKAIKDDELEWVQMSDLMFWKSKAVKLYMVNTIPYNILLDREGNILAKGLLPDELEMKLTELTKPKE